MIKYEEIAFTAYAVTNMPRARKFYEGVLGLKVTRKFAENFIEYDIGPGTLVVASAPDKWKPSPKGTSAALEVRDFKAAVEHLKKRKIKFVIGPAEYPMCSMVGIRDPDKNLIVLHKRKGCSRRCLEMTGATAVGPVLAPAFRPR
jgi:predicted enzyme related to lactoylglutathione lyase